MKTFLQIVLLILVLASTTHAVPIVTPEYGIVTERVGNPARDQCRLQYYNICSGWVYYHAAGCNGPFSDWGQPPMVGTCFDLADCPDDCRHLTDIWWASYEMTPRGVVDVEIYCADEDCCPVGQPIAGYYYMAVYPQQWHHMGALNVDLSACEQTGGKFIVMITDIGYQNFSTFLLSDVNTKNKQSGCESEWRCDGHSFIYRNNIVYCDVYGAPAPIWSSHFGGGCTNYPTVPPDCHENYGPGYSLEWLIHCYLSCEGPTAVQEGQGQSWSEVKALYR